MSFKRDRVADQIRNILSTLFLRDISDPRLQGLTVTDVKIDAELMYADIYINALGDESRQAEVLEGLKRANGFLRREVGKSVHLRNTPTLHFHWDDTLEHAERINKLISGLDIPEPDPEDEDDDDDDIFA